MKKLLLSAAFMCAAITGANAQTTIFSEDFDGATPTGWTSIDADADGDEWLIVDMSTHAKPGIAAGVNMLASYSYDNNSGPLTPDNYIFSPAIDLSAYGANDVIKLKWKASALDASYSAETYSVYVSDTNTAAAMLASTTKLSSISLSGVVDLTANELDISALAGQSTVYFAFRHHDSTDEFAIVIDDIEIITTTASSAEFFTENFNMYPNPVTDVLNIESKNGLNASEIKITDMTGKVVKVQKDVTSINVSNLSVGTYLIDITTNEGKATSKFIKK